MSMELIAKIRQAGFTIALEGEKIRLEYAGQGEPTEAAKALIDSLRERKGVVIPFNSEPKYHWWTGGQRVKETIEEIRAWIN